MLKINKLYKRLDENGKQITFPFGHKMGIYLGLTKGNKWLRFQLARRKSCIVNGGNFKEIKI